MADPARANVVDDTVRVHLRVADPARANDLAHILRERGYLFAESANADIMLTLTNANVYVLIANDTGARGQLPANSSPRQIDAALRAVAAGLNVDAPPGERFSPLEEHEAPSPLTARELEILVALSDGLSNKAIARRFDISQHTVKFHAESIFRKLDATTRAEAVVKGLRNGLVHL